MDYLEFIPRVTSHIPDKGQVAVIDIAARSEVYYKRGEEGRIVAQNGHSTRQEKRKILSLRSVATSA